jgi:predicted nucleic acid-binding protein
VLAFVDTSALVALAVRSDRNHRAATAYLDASLKRGTRFVIGRPVLVEYLDGVTKRVGKREAIGQLRLIETSAMMRVEEDAPEDHVRAREIFLQYDDQEVDMTDSLSFAMMERLGLKEAFTFDRDFAVHGFDKQPGEG